MTGLIEQGGSRRGALMPMCDPWHWDLLEFIGAKRELGKPTNASLDDDFMTAVRGAGTCELVFRDTDDPDYDASGERCVGLATAGLGGGAYQGRRALRKHRVGGGHRIASTGSSPARRTSLPPNLRRNLSPVTMPNHIWTVDS